MYELIRIQEIGGKPAVDARELHEFLKVGKDFSTWIKDRIQKYDFREDQDYSPILGKSTGGRPGVEYILSLDMAKEIAMLENNAQGKAARRYFIEVENRYRQGITQEEPKGILIARALIEAGKMLEEKDRTIQDMSLTVNAFKIIAGSEGTKDMNEVAKVLGIGPKTLRDQLHEEGVLFRQSGVQRPMQKYMDAGYFVCKESLYLKGGKTHTSTQIRVTAKGEAWLARRQANRFQLMSRPEDYRKGAAQ